MVRAMGGGLKLKERLPLCKKISIQQKLFVSCFAPGASTEEGMLATLPKAGVVGPGAIGIGNARIVLLDPSPEFVKEGVLQCRGRFQHLLDPAILSFQMRVDRGLETFRLTHHLLPVLVTKPGVVVKQRDAVHLLRLSLRSGHGSFLRGRWRDQGARSVRCTVDEGPVGVRPRAAEW